MERSTAFEAVTDASAISCKGRHEAEYDNAMMKSFWPTMQIEPLNRKKWRTRLDLANAIFDYTEIFYNRQRRHSQLDYVLPIEYELHFKNPPVPA